MRIKGIKIDEDVARILNEQDKDDTSKYRVYSNDIKDGWSILGTYDDEYSALQVYDAWKLRLLRGNGRYGVYTDVRMFKPGEKAIFSGWVILYDYVSKAFDRLAAGYSHPSQVPDFLQTRYLLEKLTRHELKLAKQEFIEKDLQAALDRWFEEANDYTNESINEDYEEDDYEDVPEEMHKERYVTYFETQEGRQRYTIYHVYTDSTDDSYNELCDKRDNQLGMYNSYKELRDALKERAEKIAEQRGWTVKSIENLGEDDEYYRERNKWESIKEGFNIGDKVWRRNPETQDRMIGEVIDKSYKDGQEYLTVKFNWWSSHDGTYPADFFQKLDKNESIKEGFNIGDKVQLKRKNNKIGIVKSIFKGDKDKNGKDIKYLDIEFEDGTKEGRPASDFKKVNEPIKEAGKCTWHAWQEGKKYACIDDCTYGHIDDFTGMEEDIERFVKAGWVNADGEIVIPAGAEFQVRKLHTPNGIVLYFPDVDMELDTGLDEDDYTLYEIINESKNEGFISVAEERQIFQCFIRCGQDIDKTIETLRLAATNFEEADIRKVCAYAYVDLASEDWFTKHPDWEEDMPIAAYNKILKDAEEILGEKLRDDYYV